MPPYQPVRPGQPFRPDAAAHNAMLRLLKDHGRAGGGAIDTAVYPINTVLVKYAASSEESLPAFSVLKYDGVIGDVPAHPKRASDRPCFVGSPPTGSTDEFMVTTQALKGEKIGDAAVSGVVPVKVLINNAAHTRAVPVDGETGHLESAATGGVPIVYKPSGTGEVWCFVRLDTGGAGDDSGGDCSGISFIDADRDCAEFEIVHAAGLCDNVAEEQVSPAEFADGVWTGTVPFLVDTDASPDEWTPRVLLPDCDHPYLRMTLTRAGEGTADDDVLCGVSAGCGRDGEGRQFADFKFKDARICDGEPAGPCGDDSLVVRFRCKAKSWWCVEIDEEDECVEACNEPEGTKSGPHATQGACFAACGCPGPNGYEGEGWYCKLPCEFPVPPGTVVFLDTDPGNEPEDGVCYCYFGPYASEAEAIAACTPGPPPSCAAGQSVSGDLNVHVSSPGCPCADGHTATAVRTDAVAWSVASGQPCSGDGPFVSIQCVNDEWLLSVWSGACFEVLASVGSESPFSITFELPGGCAPWCEADMVITFTE